MDCCDVSHSTGDHGDPPVGYQQRREVGALPAAKGEEPSAMLNFECLMLNERARE